MRPAVRFLARAGVVLAGVILTLVVLMLVAGDWIYPRLLRVVARDVAGLVLSTDGPVTVQFWPEMNIMATDLGVAPVDSSGWDARLRQITLRVEGYSLLRGKLGVTSVEMSGARGRIARAALADPLEMSELAALTGVPIRIDDAHVEIEGQASDKPHTLQIDRFTSGPGPDGHPHVEAHGSIDGSALSVDGHFSALAERTGDVMAFPLTAEISVPDWALKGTIQGHVARPLEGQGLAVDTALEIGDVAALAEILGFPAPLTGKLTARATVEGDLPSPRLAHIKARLGDAGEGAPGARIEGTGISLSSGDIASLRVQVDGPLPIGEPGKDHSVPQLSADATVQGTAGQYQVEVGRAQLTMTGETRIEASGSVELTSLDDWADAKGRLQITASTSNLAALSRLTGIELPDLGPATLQGQLSGPLTGATLEDAELTVGTKGKGALHLSAKGKAGPLQFDSGAKLVAAMTTDMQIQVSTASVAALSRLTGIKLPDLGPATLQGRLSGPLSSAMLEDAELIVGTKGKGALHLSAKGKAGPLQFDSGEKLLATMATDMRIQVSTASVAALSRLIGIKLPDLGPATLQGRLSGPLSGATLEDADLTVGTKGKGALHFSAKGKAGPLRLHPGTQLMAAAKTDLRVELRTDDLKTLSKDLPAPLSALESWSVLTRLRTSPQGWRLDELTISAGRQGTASVKLTGAAAGPGGLAAGVKRMVAGTGKKGDTADLKAVVEIPDARATARLTGINIPELGAIKGQARIRTDGSGAFAVRGLALRSLGALPLRLTGDIGALHGLRDVKLDLKLAETSPEVIDRLLDLELSLAQNVSLEGTLRRPGEQVLSLEGEAKVGSSRFALALTAQRTATVPLIKGRITSARIHAVDFWERTSPAAAKPGRSAGRAASGSIGLLEIVPGLDFVLQDSREQEQAAHKASKADELPWHRLKRVDVELDVHADAVQGVHMNGGPLDLRLVDRAGRLEFGPFKLNFKGGSLVLDGVADSNANPPSMEVKGRGEKIPIQELAAYGALKSLKLRGELHVDYDLRSRGRSLQQLRESLSGDLKMVVEHGQFPLRSLDLLSASLLEWLATWARHDADTPVPCGVADLDIKGGIATVKTLYVKTDKSAAYGTGHLNLRDDSVDLTVMPKVSGLSLSPPTTVRVHGPLGSPKLNVVNPQAVALHYGIEIAEDIEFPPVILLRSLFSHASDKASSPCP